ncbi:MAG TPA: PASTA domain-containing protein [Gemmatimonadaceae bacterium]|nr:PASTA domain-containing protein [Gemmatimonadaceae bacterium]
MSQSRLSAAFAVAASLLGLWNAPMPAQIQPRPQTTAARVALIPDVTGQAVDSAISRLAWTRLPIVRLDTLTTAQKPGFIVLQRPDHGTPVSRARTETLMVATARRRPPVNVLVDPRLLGRLAGGGTSDAPPAARDTVVPDLSGRTPALAAATLDAAGLRRGRETRDYSDDMPPGRVYRQEPQPGVRVGMGRSVDVWYSLGPHRAADTVTVPPIEGRFIDEAIRALKEHTLRLGHVDSAYRTGAKGTISHQEPDAGTIAHRNDAVDVTVDVPPRLIPVPSVIGLTRDAARDTIEANGFEVGAISIVSRAGASATIDSQRPVAGAMAAPRSLVDLVEVQAPRVATVPDLAGKTETEAERLLAANNLVLGTVVRHDEDSSAKVVDQGPPPNRIVELYSRVNVSVGRGAQRDDTFLRVPRVISMTVGAAQQMLADSGLTRIAIRGDSVTAAAVVRSQSPRAGTLVRPTAVISLVAEEVVTLVPGLVGRGEDSARAEAARHKFSMQVANRHRRIRFSEVVVSQTPVANTPDDGGRHVDVDLAIPIVPPPVEVALGLGIVGMTSDGARRIWRRWKERKKPKPPAGIDVHLEGQFADPPVLTPAGGDRLIRSTIEFGYELDAPPWDVHCATQTLVKSEKPRNG